MSDEGLEHTVIDEEEEEAELERKHRGVVGFSRGERGRAREGDEQQQHEHHQAGKNNSTAASAAAGTGWKSSSLRVRSSGAAAAAGTASTAGGRVQTRVARTTKSGGKDRHSKVNTARGPRDRRVRLSVSTAIQFYDIQDRLGFDQPSKAIEWLLRKAKPAIDELNQLPPAPLSIGRQGSGSVSTTATATAAAADAAALKEENSNSQTTAGEATLFPYQFHPQEQDSTSSRRDDRVEEDLVSGVKVAKQERLELEPHRHQEDHHHQQDLASFFPPPQLLVPHQGAALDMFQSYNPSSSTSLLPMRSSFTQLLQSPFPASLQGFIPTSQNLHLLQGLYNLQPPPAFSHQSFQQEIFEASQHSASLHSLHCPQQIQHPQTGVEGRSNIISQQQHHHGPQGQQWTSSSPGVMISPVPYPRGSSIFSAPGAFSPEVNTVLPRQQHTSLSSRPPASSSPLYMVPARIQGLDDDDDGHCEHGMDHQRRHTQRQDNEHWEMKSKR